MNLKQGTASIQNGRVPLVKTQGDDALQARIRLHCPECQKEAHVDWSALGRALECPHCACTFVVTRDGSLVSLDRMRQIYYRCPRCHSKGSVAEALAHQSTSCKVCRLPLEMAHDGRLYSLEDAARIRREAPVKRGNTELWALYFERQLQDSSGRLRWRRIALSLCIVLLFMASAVRGLSVYWDVTPRTSSERLIRHCLANRVSLAEYYVQDDVLQLSQFERWRMLYLTSLRNSFRPRGDYVSVESSVVRSTPTLQTLELTLRSKVIGQRKLLMQWKLVNKAWKFDVVQTMAAKMTLIPVRVRQQQSAPSVPQGRRPVSPILVP